MKSSTMEEREKMFGSTMYIKLSGDYNKIDKRKDKKAITRHRGILKYLTKEVEIRTEDEKK